MRIYVYTGNHGNSVGISDIVTMLASAIRDSGHDACISPELVSGACNVMIEHFNEEAHLRHLLERKTPGTRYVLIGTELITGDTFNTGLVGQHWHYDNHAYWKTRWEGFKFASRLADVVWVLSDLAVPMYQAALPGMPVRFLPHGWVSEFPQVRHRPEADKDIDFYFSGTLTDHRRAIVTALAAKHKVWCLGQSTPDYVRLDMLSRSKVCLSLRLGPENTLPSVSRMHFHLQNANFLIHEAYEQPSLLDPYVMHAQPAEVVEWARAALELPNRREIAEGVRERFRREMPLSKWMKPMLDEALGLTAPAGGLRHAA